MSKSTDQHSGLVSIARLPRRMPANWEPPAPAWAASFPTQSTPVVMAYFGTQLGSLDPKSLNEQPIYEFFDCADAPQNVESAKFTDRSGCRNFISAAYWIDPASYERWKANSGFDA